MPKKSHSTKINVFVLEVYQYSKDNTNQKTLSTCICRWVFDSAEEVHEFTGSSKEFKELISRRFTEAYVWDLMEKSE